MLKDLKAAVEKSGLKIVEVAGWQTRGHGSIKTVKSIICHHTAGAKTGNYPSLNTVAYGRPGLAGPLGNLGLGRDGTVYIIAAGIAWHAGVVSSSEYSNSYSIGIEAEATGVDKWPAVQMEAYAKLCKALSQHYGVPVSKIKGHKEVAVDSRGRLGRKIDPNFNMTSFRGKVESTVLGGYGKPKYTAGQFPTLQNPKKGVRGDHVLWIKKRLKAHGYKGFVLKSNYYGKGAVAAVKAFQRAQGWSGSGADGYPGTLTISELYKSPKPPKKELLRVAHASLQFSDSLKQRQSDAKKIFARAKAHNIAWITGTEAFEASTFAALKKEAAATGYIVRRNANQDSWVAVRKDLVKGKITVHYDRVIKGKAKKHTAKGGFGISFESTLGVKVGILAGHLLTKGRPGAKDPAYKVNVATNRAIMKSYGKIAKALRSEGAIVFYGGDQNISAKGNSFLGQPFISAWRELKKYPKTHAAGCIDMVAYYDDVRVRWVGGRRFGDKTAMGLHSDHLYIEAVCELV